MSSHLKTQTLLLVLLVGVCGLTRAQDWKIQPLQIPTRWTSSVNPQNALPEYPRPQLVRPEWQNLNGLWHFVITGKSAPIPADYDHNILVPYPLESALSGVQEPLHADQLLWYQRCIQVSQAKNGDRT